MFETTSERRSGRNDIADGAVTIVDVLLRRAEQTPDQRVFLFLENGEREAGSYTFAELDRNARIIGSRLESLGARGKRVLLAQPPGLEFVSSFFGCLYSGAVAVPSCSTLLSTRQRDRLKFVLKDSEAEFLLAASSQSLTDFHQSHIAEELKSPVLLAVNEIEEIEGANWSPTHRQLHEPAYIQYTSGSISDPRGVVISHGNVMCNQRMIQSAFANAEGSVVVSWLPHFHDMGLVGIVQQSVYAGMSAVLMAPIDFIRKPVRWLRAISKYRAAKSGGPNFAYDLCVERVKDEEVSGLDLSCWQVAFNGSEPVKLETLERFAHKFEKAGFGADSFYPCYGLAEATLLVSSRLPSRALSSRPLESMSGAADQLELVSVRPSSRQAVSCGPAAGNARVLIVDPKTHTRCSDGVEGELWLAGPHVANGYWKRPQETREVFAAYLSDTGEGPFLRTGDLGCFVDGELYITGRLKELVILHGKNHYPHDIEATVAGSHPLLRRDCGAAFSVDVTGHEELVVFQEVKRQTPPEKVVEIKGAIRKALAEERGIKPYSVILFRPNAIPKTSSGKVMRAACRADFLRNSFANAFSAPDCL